MRLLDFPADVLTALSNGEINLFKAAQLARVMNARLSSHSQARRTCADLLSTHLQTKESGPRLRQRINELLKASISEEQDGGEAAEAEMNLEDFDPYDPTHLFWDQIKQLGFALRGNRPEDVNSEEIDKLLRVSEPVLTVLARIQWRKERGAVKKLEI